MSFVDEPIDNFVVLIGDVHSNYMADLRVDFEDESSPAVGSEFIGTSISSTAGPGRQLLVPGMRAVNR